MTDHRLRPSRYETLTAASVSYDMVIRYCYSYVRYALGVAVDMFFSWLNVRHDHTFFFSLQHEYSSRGRLTVIAERVRIQTKARCEGTCYFKREACICKKCLHYVRVVTMESNSR